MTETCGFSVLNRQGATRIGSVGVPFDGVEAQIRALGDDGSELADDTILVQNHRGVKGMTDISSFTLCTEDFSTFGHDLVRPEYVWIDDDGVWTSDGRGGDADGNRRELCRIAALTGRPARISAEAGAVQSTGTSSPVFTS